MVKDISESSRSLDEGLFVFNPKANKDVKMIDSML